MRCDRRGLAEQRAAPSRGWGASDLWQIKDLQTAILEVWQTKGLGTDFVDLWQTLDLPAFLKAAEVCA